MKKLVSVVLLFSLICSIAAACGKVSDSPGKNFRADTQNTGDTQKQSDTQEETGTDVFVMRVGHAQSEESARQRSLESFKEQVEQKTGGKVVVKIYPNGEIGDESEMTAAVEDGDLEAVRGGDLEFVPKTTMLGLPMVADNLEEARKLCYSDFVKNMLSTAETDHNMKVLAVGDDSGFRQITNNVRPIKAPADMKGLKMRVVLDVIDLSMQAFGASTQTIPFTELYDALKDGTVDGQENPLALIDSNKFYEVQKYCTIIDYMFFAELFYVNLDWWNKLPAEYQDILTSCAQTMMEENARITDEENAAYLKHIQDSGCEVYTLTKEEREAFRPLAERVWQEYVDNGRISKEELDQMLAVIGKKADW